MEEDYGPLVLVGAGDVERVLTGEVVVGEDGCLGPLGELQGLGSQRLDSHRPLLGCGVRVVDDLAAELRPARADRQRARGDSGVALFADEAGEQIGRRVEPVGRPGERVGLQTGHRGALGAVGRDAAGPRALWQFLLPHALEARGRVEGGPGSEGPPVGGGQRADRVVGADIHG
ncbi:hypothetical protein H0E86_20345 [Streptomyces sp. SCSIO-PteL053]|nr:hypothetical protein H0E86_20345 [Streptomyces sp. SCSIO-PteL053]